MTAEMNLNKPAITINRNKPISSVDRNSQNELKK